MRIPADFSLRCLIVSLSVALGACSPQSSPEPDEKAQGNSNVDIESVITELEAVVAEAELEVQRLKAVEEIENLISIYGYYVDKSMHDDVADLFARDATLEILGRGVFYGIDRIRGYMHNFGAVGPSDGSLFNHTQLQTIVTVADDGQTAYARSRNFVMFGIENVQAQFGEATYENEFILEDGVWKFNYLHGYQGHYTIYEDGWANKASAIFAPYDRFPPDDLQSVEYAPYPAAFVPPFHYPNPVTKQ